MKALRDLTLDTGNKLKKISKALTEEHFNIIANYVEKNGLRQSGTYHYLLWRNMKGSNSGSFFNIFPIECYVCKNLDIITDSEYERVLDMLNSEDENDITIALYTIEFMIKERKKKKNIKKYEKYIIDDRSEFHKVIIDERKRFNKTRIQ